MHIVVNVTLKKKTNIKRETISPYLEFDILESSTQFIFYIRCSLELRVMSEAQLGNVEHPVVPFPTSLPSSPPGARHQCLSSLPPSEKTSKQTNRPHVDPVMETNTQDTQ